MFSNRVYVSKNLFLNKAQLIHNRNIIITIKLLKYAKQFFVVMYIIHNNNINV